MENNESTQQQSSELSYSKHAQSSRRPAQLATLNSLLQLLKRWPWLVWPGVWTFLLLITAIAIFSLTYTGEVQQEKPKPKPAAVENPVETSSQTSSPMPIWLLGAVALTFVAGSLVIVKRKLNSSHQPTKIRQRQRSSARGLTRRQQRKQLLEERPPMPTRLEEPQPPVAPVAAETEPVVTVVPPEESHPLDAGSESLAEMMDIRKQRSLSSFLGDNFKES